MIKHGLSLKKLELSQKLAIHILQELLMLLHVHLHVPDQELGILTNLDNITHSALFLLFNKKSIQMDQSKLDSEFTQTLCLIVVVSTCTQLDNLKEVMLLKF